MVKNLPAMQETQVQSLGQADTLEKEMATHSSIPAWRIPWTEEPGRLQFMGSQRVEHDWVTNIPHGVYYWWAEFHSLLLQERKLPLHPILGSQNAGMQQTVIQSDAPSGIYLLESVIQESETLGRLDIMEIWIIVAKSRNGRVLTRSFLLNYIHDSCSC